MICVMLNVYFTQNKLIVLCSVGLTLLGKPGMATSYTIWGGGGREGMVYRYRYLAHSVYDFYVYVTAVSLSAVLMACPVSEPKCAQKCCLRQCGK